MFRFALPALALALLAAAPASAVVIQPDTTTTVDTLGTTYETGPRSFERFEVIEDLFRFDVTAAALAATGGFARLKFEVTNFDDELTGTGGPFLTGPGGVLVDFDFGGPKPFIQSGAQNTIFLFRTSLGEPGLYTVRFGGGSLAPTGQLGVYSATIAILTPLPIPALLLGAGMLGLAAARRARA